MLGIKIFKEVTVGEKLVEIPVYTAVHMYSCMYRYWFRFIPTLEDGEGATAADSASPT